MGKKIVAAISLVLLSGTILVSCTDDKNWSFVENESYSILPIQCENPILVKHFQDSDYLNNNFGSQGGLKIASLTEDEAKVKSLSTDSYVVEEEAFNVTIETLQGNDKIKMKKIMADGSELALPDNPDELKVQFVITPDGQQSFLASDIGIWSVKDSDHTEKISPDRYNFKSYHDLAEWSTELYEENIVRWNENVIPDPSSTKLAYVSNKHDIYNEQNALFIYDLTSGMESISARSGNANYMIEGWLNSGTVLCMKIERNQTGYVAVPLDGEEVPLEMIGADPFVYAVQNALIAYTEFLGSPDLHFAKYLGTDGIEEIKSVKVGWQTRVRGGNYGFSPDDSKFACLYIPVQNQQTRYIQVINLTERKVIDIDSLPGDSDFMIEFSWIDNETLMVVAGKNNNDIIEESTWIYDLSGGEKK